LVSDSELSLDEWRGEAGEIPARDFYAYLKFSGTQPDGELRLLIDDLLWIDGDDTKTLEKYGFDPKEVTDDYELYNEVEKWVPVVTFPETTFNILYYDESSVPYIKSRDVDRARFKQYLCKESGDRIFAKVTVAGEYIFSVREIYLP
jgi:hypothetical protein